MIAEGFFLAVVFVLGSFAWSRIAADDRSLGSVALWHLFRLNTGEWLAFVALAGLARWTWLRKLRMRPSRASAGLFRASAVLSCAQLAGLVLVGPIASIILAPFTLGLAFILTLIANARVISGIVRR